MTDVKQALQKGLQATPKYIPVWYRYDKQGSVFNDKCLSDNHYYYFYGSEVAVLKQHVQAMVGQVPLPITLVEMGSGNSVKSRMFIDTILEKQPALSYFPVDISSEFLQETVNDLSADYGDRLEVSPIAGDYNLGIDRLGTITGNKLVIWLGGGFQNQAYPDQLNRLERISSRISNTDRVFIALDVSNDRTEIENAYLDPTGVSTNLYFNAVWRLNREYGSNIDTDQFQVEVEYVNRAAPGTTSYVAVRARAKKDLTYSIPGLQMTVDFKAGECINFYEGDGNSCKYSQDQIKTLVEKGGMKFRDIWVDNSHHVALCCLGI